MSVSSLAVATLGTPRIGPHRELKAALESFWAGKSSESELLATAARLRAENWTRQKARGVTVIPSNDFSLYDHVLDTSVMVGAVPDVYGWKDGADHYWCGARDQGDVWLFDKPHKNDLHPTMKPVALVERAIRNSSKSRDIVLDLFGGSGSTMIAAERTGRRARLLELDPRYVDVIVQRWQETTGGSASHAAGGQRFAAA